jgi:hypothetical protein
MAAAAAPMTQTTAPGPAIHSMHLCCLFCALCTGATMRNAPVFPKF